MVPQIGLLKAHRTGKDFSLYLKHNEVYGRITLAKLLAAVSVIGPAARMPAVTEIWPNLRFSAIWGCTTGRLS